MTTERKNINRGFRKLRVWEDAIDLYVTINKTLSKIAMHNLKTSSNIIDAANSISRNIAEGYGRRGKKEYLNFLNYSLGSCAECYSGYFSFYKAGLITEETYEEIDKLHYKVENQLIKLIESLQRKNTDDWSDNFNDN